MAPVTLYYGGLLGALFIWLSARTIRARRAARVLRGDGGDVALTTARGVHSNTAEYVPFTLVLMGLCELSGLPVLLVHGLGIALLLGRIIYILGVRNEAEDLRLRVAGMMLTFTALGGASVAAVALAVLAL